MRRFFEKIFPKKKTQVIEISLARLESWLAEQLTGKEVHASCRGYLTHIAQFQRELLQKAEALKLAEISTADKRQVDVSIQNVVKGHRDHYAREIQQFAQSLATPIKLTSLREYFLLQQFNQELQENLDLLGKKTNKSYQAAQHLFFDTVEEIFKLLGELNRTAKSFPKDKISALQEIATALDALYEERNKQDALDQSITGQNETISQLSAEREKCQQHRAALMNSNEYLEYQQKEEMRKKILVRLKEVEDAVHSFFAKLQKPLKKYERMAGNSRLIHWYVENSIEAFQKDTELRIVNELQLLAKNLQYNRIEAEDRQKKNYLELISQNQLRELQQKMNHLQQENQKMEHELKGKSVWNELQKIDRQLALYEQKINPVSKEREEMLVKVGKLNVGRKEEILVASIKKGLGMEVRII